MGEEIINIKFSKVPKVKVRVISLSDSDVLIVSKKRFPFELEESVEVEIITDKRTVNFGIKAGYTWNGADIPRFLWRLIGSRTDNDFLIASMLHDWLLDFKFYMIEDILYNKMSVKEYRRFTSLVFRYILKNQGTNAIKANVMSYFTDLFQMLNKAKWRRNGHNS